MVIVGAGPGGSMTAKYAAEMGLDILLIEKRQEIGDPVRCAEGVAKITLKNHVEPDPRWICADVTGSRIFSPDMTMVEMNEEMSGGEVGYVLERKVFDRALVDASAMAGAKVMVKTRATGLIIENDTVCGVRVMHLGEEQDIRCKIVIGADGIESKIGRWGGIDTSCKPADIETCVQYLVTNIDIDPNFCHFYLGKEIAPAGYVWAFPKGNGTANLGVGILGSRSGKKKPIDYLNEFKEKHFPNSQIIEMVYGGVPVIGPIERTIANGLMLVGDAARQSDPITGGGIINAMDAGKIAADVAVKAIKKGDCSTNSLQEYEDRWRATIGEDISYTLKVKDTFINFSDEELNSLAHSVEGIAIHKMTIRDLLGALFKSNKKLLWSLRGLVKEAKKDA